MKKAILFFLAVANGNLLNAQTCTPANSPNLGEDKTIFVSCFQDVADLTRLYNTTGLAAHWDILNPSTAKIGYHWLVVTNSNGCKDTAYINVKQDVKKWLGTVDSNWHNPANWSGNSVPTDKSHILIFEGTPYPCVIGNTDATAASVRVLNGGTYTVKNNLKINIVASCDTLPAYYETGPKTILIDNPTSQTIQSVDSSHVIFNGNTFQLKSLDTSNIIVSGIAANAPYGFLRKVKAIQKAGNIYTITTGDVPMETAFKDFFFEYSQPYVNSDTSLRQARSTADESAFPVSLNYQFSANVSASGSLTVKPSLTVRLDISNFHLNYAKIEGSFDRVANMGLSISGAANASSEVTVFEKQLRPFYIPYTPFVVVPVLKVKLGSEAATDVSYNASITNTSSVNAYLEYTNGDWHNGYGRTTSTEYNFSGVNGNVNAKLYAEPSVDFKLYNQDWAKGTIKAQVYVTGEAKTQPKPSCKLSAGITAGVAANLQMFGISFLDANYPELFKYEKVLYECFKPKVTTNPFTSQCDSVAIANVTDSGSSRIKARGFCWSEFHDPTVFTYKKEQTVEAKDATKGLGMYQDTLSHLTPNIDYYLRAYAINNTDTAYGDEISFKAPVHIGDTLEGGIVFYLDSTCHHGLVCAMSDQSVSSVFTDSVRWGTELFTTDSIGSGANNTDLIISALVNGAEAAILCRNYNSKGYDDWFLPSYLELRELYHKKDYLNNSMSSIYWSSTCVLYNKNIVIPNVCTTLDFNNGQASNVSVDETHKVRAVRKF